MKESLHYLLMSDHLMFQKALDSRVKDTGLTPGQPKILDYLLNHDGAIQKDIAVFCHIEPASLTVILSGMENKGYIKRQTDNGNRRRSEEHTSELQSPSLRQPTATGIFTDRVLCTERIFCIGKPAIS